VLFLEHKRLYSLSEEQTPENGVLAPGQARVVRAGGDLTLVSVMKGVHDALAAAELLAGDGLDVEVIDLRSLRPLDLETVLRSVERTNLVLAVEEGPQLGGWAAGLVGAVASEALGDLDDAWVLATPDTPVPYSPPLEDAFLPGAQAIADSVRTRLRLAAERS